MSRIVTLLTDFGDEDGFVGAMRGVILSRAPDVQLVDLAHHVPRGDVAKAARVLRRAAVHFPAGTVHCSVVDPGVGTERAAVAVEAGRQYFVAPDNGLLGEVLDALGGAQAAHLLRAPVSRRATVSSTFHGRDVFAPGVAALAAGVSIAELGPPAGNLQRLARAAGGQVVEVDRFGNLITDLPIPQGEVELVIAGHRLRGPVSAYGAVGVGALVLVRGSEGTLEVAVRDGSAADRLGVGVGATVACAALPIGSQSAK
ncbi:MAG: SAM-dependent chlorinase/fluorinase [Myxococcales bacterium]|nr:SAM-dependent chlorinase/fluorinase [Myxococcales bacterium]